MTEPTGKGMSDEELAKQVMPSILELQKVLVQNARNSRQFQHEVGYVSLTSCDHHSCGGPGGGGGGTIM
ncbi:hypothetical protein ABZY68_36610 [Streptomyces sp. NPDC006482]|uniref:hypothetical protein n=1 Tax=unclassified Streptomyces TaxID=2593676 RepID=UPI00225BEFE7|nr:hypothetical protein [Streptomyces sp. NBC_00094]MCX5395063.1 hypothetical protein [Streptomyces sp. NBC_00094]